MRMGINKVFKSEGKWEGKLQRILYNQTVLCTCRQRVCGQNKDNLCLQAARTLIWRSCAFNRGPMTMPVLDGPMTMPVLDGVKPMAIALPICGTSESLFWKRKKSIYCWTRSRPTWTFGESNDQVRDKSESKYQRVQDKSETIEKRLSIRFRDRTRVLQPYWRYICKNTIRWPATAHDITTGATIIKGPPGEYIISFFVWSLHPKHGPKPRGRSVSFPTRGTMVTYVTWDVPLHGNSNCVP